MSDLIDPRPTVGDTNLLQAITENPQAALSLITAYRMEMTLSWVDQFIKMRDRMLKAEGKHSKLLLALGSHERVLKQLGDEHRL